MKNKDKSKNRIDKQSDSLQENAQNKTGKVEPKKDRKTEEKQNKVKIEQLTNELTLSLEKVNRLNQEIELWRKKYEDYGKQMQEKFTKKINEVIQISKNELSKEKERVAHEIESKIDIKIGNIFTDIVDNVLNISRKVLTLPDHASKELQNYAKGFEMLITTLERILMNYGLTIVYPKVNEAFNPTIHHAISKVYNKHVSAAGVISEIITPQYCLHGKTISYAKVRVATSQK